MITLIAFAIIGLLLCYTASHQVVLHYPETYTFLMPILESPLIPRTGALLRRIYAVLLHRTERLVETDEKKLGISPQTDDKKLGISSPDRR